MNPQVTQDESCFNQFAEAHLDFLLKPIEHQIHGENENTTNCMKLHVPEPNKWVDNWKWLFYSMDNFTQISCSRHIIKTF